MSEMDPNDRPSPALAAVIAEARADEPAVDWARVEARLFADERVLQAPPRRTRFVAVAGGLALAAAFAVALLSPTRKNESTTSPVAVTRPAMLGDDGHTIAVGERIVAPQGGWIRSIGRVSIHLEPGAVATVLDVGERVHLSLESGAVVADVTPVPGGEPFAVDVAGKRVAVHGTRLRVAVVSGGVQVAVSEGNVVVGDPRGRGRTEGTIVPAGSVGDFLGGSSSIVANRELATHLVDDSLVAKISAPAPVVKSAPVSTLPTVIVASAAPAKHVAPSAPANTAVVEPPPKLGLSAEQLDAPLAAFAAKIGHCAPKTFENTLTLHVDPNGQAQLVGEDPGLDSPMRVCVREELARVTFPLAEGATTVKRYVKFSGK